MNAYHGTIFATAIVEFKASWHGNEFIQVPRPARVTAKRVYVGTDFYDRTTGKRLSAYNPHAKSKHLLRVIGADGAVLHDYKAEA